ncbi:MAG: hypothetical protein HKN21_06705 [Candidatus Eisenbacteria bacterium]|uniref:Uncharacterized protein n=1 Tax=Eiseniibacteriota bacterium TaxID=2212470 RepID=A0A7Y2EEC2_UNCEI|nr:hypothetical protein [Candidatus Eisenbacteria bacterium]
MILNPKGVIMMAVGVGLGLSLAGEAFAQPIQDRTKLQRQMRVIERITSQILVESPYFFVQESEPAGAIYLDGYGVVLSFNASLVEKDGWEWPWKDINVDHDEDGNITIRTKRDADYDDEEEAELIENYRTWLSKKGKQQERTYERGKQEMYDLLTDYAESLTRLKDNEMLTLAIHLKRSEFFEESEIHHLVMHAKMSDVRSLRDGDDIEDILHIEEY